MHNTIYYVVKTWNNGNKNSSGAGYGIRISIKDFDDLKDWEEIIIDNDSIKRINHKLTKKCPEIRSKIIGKFLIKNALNIWKYREPFELKLYKIEENKYELKIL